MGTEDNFNFIFVLLGDFDETPWVEMPGSKLQVWEERSKVTKGKDLRSKIKKKTNKITKWAEK